MTMKQHTLVARQGGTPTGKAAPVVFSWAPVSCVVITLLCLLLCIAGGASAAVVPASSPTLDVVQYAEPLLGLGAAAPLWEPNDTLDAGILVEPHYELSEADAKALRVEPNERSWPIDNPNQPVKCVSYKIHSRDNGLFGTQWSYAIVERKHLGKGTVPNNLMREYVRLIGGDVGGLGRDHTGHIVADRLGGLGTVPWNVFPQLASINTGSFRVFEAGAAAKVQEHMGIVYFVRMAYHEPSTTDKQLRPKSFQVAYAWCERNVCNPGGDPRVHWYGEWFRNE